MTDPGGTAALEIEALRFRHPGAGRDLIEIDALSLGPGEAMLLTGGSGTGKSTLLHLVAGLLEPSAGRVRVGGQDMHALRGARRDRFRGRHVGMIFQTHHLLAGFTAAENVMAALMFSEAPRAGHRETAEALLRELGIERVGALPDELSVGQQQRVAVARAVVCSPALVLADEPTASLDPGAAGATMDLIQRACAQRGAALLCVSHDPAMAERFEHRRALAPGAAAGAEGAGVGTWR